MTERRIIADIASMPVDQVKAELAAVQAERSGVRKQLEALQARDSRLVMEEQLLAQMLRLGQWEADGMPGAPDVLTAVEAAAPEGRRHNLSATVLAVVREARAPLTPADVRDRLLANGVEADLSAIRVALRRWRERGELIKQDRHYTDRSAVTLLSATHHGGGHSQ